MPTKRNIKRAFKIFTGVSEKRISDVELQKLVADELHNSNLLKKQLVDICQLLGKNVNNKLTRKEMFENVKSLINEFQHTQKGGVIGLKLAPTCAKIPTKSNLHSVPIPAPKVHVMHPIKSSLTTMPRVNVSQVGKKVIQIDFNSKEFNSLKSSLYMNKLKENVIKWMQFAESWCYIANNHIDLVQIIINFYVQPQNQDNLQNMFDAFDVANLIVRLINDSSVIEYLSTIIDEKHSKEEILHAVMRFTFSQALCFWAIGENNSEVIINQLSAFIFSMAQDDDFNGICINNVFQYFSQIMKNPVAFIVLKV